MVEGQTFACRVSCRFPKDCVFEYVTKEFIIEAASVVDMSEAHSLALSERRRVGYSRTSAKVV